MLRAAALVALATASASSAGVRIIAAAGQALEADKDAQTALHAAVSDNVPDTRNKVELGPSFKHWKRRMNAPDSAYQPKSVRQ